MPEICLQGLERFLTDQDGERDKIRDQVISMLGICVPQTSREQKLHRVLEFGRSDELLLIPLHQRQGNTHERLGGTFGQNNVVDPE